LKILIFDCLSFTEGLITSLFTADGEKNGENNICFNHVIELNQKMLILNRFAAEKMIF
jgi:hypothetical protein